MAIVAAGVGRYRTVFGGGNTADWSIIWTTVSKGAVKYGDGIEEAFLSLGNASRTDDATVPPSEVVKCLGSVRPLRSPVRVTEVILTTCEAPHSALP